MIFFVATIALAIIVVVATKGSFERLGRLRFRMLWLLFLGLAVQIVLEVVDFPKDRIEDLGFAILLLSYVAILGFCFANRSVRGMTLIAIGVALNVLVIALNQGMPTKDDVRERDGREVRVPIEQTVKHRPQEDDDLLGFLGDVITVPGVPEPAVLDRRHRDGTRDRRPLLRGQPRAATAWTRSPGGSRSAELIVEQAAPVEHHLERRDDMRVVEVLRRAAQRFEREARSLRVTVGELVERARDLEDLARHHRRSRGHVLAVGHPLGGDDVAGGGEQLRAAEDRRARLRDRHRLRRSTVVGLVEADLAEVVQQRRRSRAA